MATLTLAAAQVGSWHYSTGTLGTALDVSDSYLGGVRFTGVAVPAGSILEEARLAITGRNRPDRTQTIAVAALAVDNAPPLTSGQHDDSVTTATAISTAAATIQSWDVTAVLAEILVRPGWSSGNAVALRLTLTDGVGTAIFTGTPALTLTYSDPWAAGPAQTVQPWSTVTLTGTPAGAPWVQTSGPTVTLTPVGGGQATFVAPASMTAQTLGFTYGGDPTTVTVRAARHGIITTGGTVPTRLDVL